MNIIKENKIEKVDDDTDYRLFYFIGIIFMPIGIAVAIATRNPGFFGLMVFGLIFLIISIVNKDKWYDIN
jgi:hypothetical protein